MSGSLEFLKVPLDRFKVMSEQERWAVSHKGRGIDRRQERLQLQHFVYNHLVHTKEG